jgi:uncharacterized YccA/Bax inhibitor family protein
MTQMAYRTGNPALGNSMFEGIARPQVETDRMTLQGTVNKSFLLLAVLVLAAAWPWSRYFAGDVGMIRPLMMVGLLGGFGVALVIIFKKHLAPVLSIPYAILEGVAIGGISAVFEAQYPGIVIQAAGLTFAILAALLFAYTSRLIRATENFKLGVVAATGGIALFYVASIVLGFFGVTMPFLHDSGPVGILVSLAIVVIASLNLVLDFDFIETGVQRGAPRYFEWYGAFGLLVTLIWLYLEVLRLLGKSRR